MRDTLWIVVAVLSTMRIAGERGEAFQAVAHLVVGGLFAAGIACCVIGERLDNVSYPLTGNSEEMAVRDKCRSAVETCAFSLPTRLLFAAAFTLTAVEVACFVAKRIM